jgi:hypothetical protein
MYIFLHVFAIPTSNHIPDTHRLNTYIIVHIYIPPDEELVPPINLTPKPGLTPRVSSGSLMMFNVSIASEVDLLDDDIDNDDV